MTEVILICQDCKTQYLEIPEDGQCEECYGFEFKAVLD